MIITFQGAYGQQAIPDLTVTSSLTGVNATATVETTTVGGVIELTTLIKSVPNTTAAIDGNNAQVRVIIDGSGTRRRAPALCSMRRIASLRGLAIEGFGIGVSVPNPTDVGDLIQGNFIGEYLAYPVDPNTGVALPAPNNVELIGLGNTQQGVVLGSSNATVGGTDPQDSNVIAGNAMQGVLIAPGASGNQVLGNQIGVVGPSSKRLVLCGGQRRGRSADRVVGHGFQSVQHRLCVEQQHWRSGGGRGQSHFGQPERRRAYRGRGGHAEPGRGELHRRGTRRRLFFGNGQPGNAGDGVFIDDAPDNQVGGGASSDGNVISSNAGNGVNITGADATGNTVLNNIIGLTSAGTAVLGNDQAGVADTAPGTMIGPGNVISANLIGVLISGATATNVTVIGNLIGTDLSGEADLGNAQAGVDIESATGVIVEGNGQGSQVISGNATGVKTLDASRAPACRADNRSLP